MTQYPFQQRFTEFDMTDNTPWYKQFWPWFLIAIPTSSFIVAFFVVKFATNTTDSLVVDDYYKEGKAINAKMEKQAQAKRLRILTDLTIDGQTIALKFHSGIPQSGEALKLAFFHTTLSEKDNHLLLTRDANGIYRGYAEKPLEGKWQVTLTPLDDSWKIQHVISLPQSGVIQFNPK